MGLNVISNHAANVAHRNLSTTDAEATASLSKLSSGTRVVSAKDDAASLAIGSRLNAEVQALRQATVNAGQAVSMLQIADGAMARTNDILIRMKTLAVQSSSGQLSDTERSMLDTEYQQLINEIDRIAADTEFNGNPLVNGTNATDTRLPEIADAAANRLQASDGFASIEFGPQVGDAAFSVSYDATDGVLTLKNLVDGRSQGLDIDAATPIDVNDTQEVVFDDLGVTITLNNAFDKSADILPSGTFSAAVVGGQTGGIAATGIRLVSGTPAAGLGLTSLAATVGADVTDTAAAAELVLGSYTSSSVDLTTTGVKTATFTDGTDSFTVEFVVTEAFNDARVQAQNSTISFDGLGAVVYGEATANSGSTSFTFKLGTGTVSNVDTVTYGINAINANALGLNASSIDEQATADAAIDTIGTAIDRLNTSRANLGASQNRLEFAAANLSVSIENAEAARSSLLDLDVASEMTRFTGKQVLMQAGVAMLAQANQMPQNLLRLLQG